MSKIILKKFSETAMLNKTCLELSPYLKKNLDHMKEYETLTHL
jgi:hypothetical protein